jgi:hypothetical protein
VKRRILRHDVLGHRNLVAVGLDQLTDVVTGRLEGKS